ASAAAVVLVGGGVATYVAVSSSSDNGGAASPKAAVETLVSDLNNADLIGLLDDLPPGERDAVSKPVQKVLADLKRTHVLKPDADLSHVAGITLNVSGLTFAADTIAINGNVQIVQLTGGKITASGDVSKLPLASDF